MSAGGPLMVWNPLEGPQPVPGVPMWCSSMIKGLLLLGCVVQSPSMTVALSPHCCKSLADVPRPTGWPSSFPCSPILLNAVGLGQGTLLSTNMLCVEPGRQGNEARRANVWITTPKPDALALQYCTSACA
jgi:hypothetical protein